MNNRSMRFAKLMQSMGISNDSERASKKTPNERIPISPDKFQALTGTAHSESKDKSQIKMLIDSKIAQLEQSDDPIALESLNFWKQKRDELDAE